MFEPILLTRERGKIPFLPSPSHSKAGAPTQSTTRQRLTDYREEGGYGALTKALSGLSPRQVIDEIEASQLRGRGGARFPTARKWRLAAEQEHRPKYVIANGGEHEPGSGKDNVLIELYPHKVIEGMLLCAYATGASRGHLYLIEDMSAAIASAELALQEIRSAGLLGDKILQSRFSFDIEIHRAPKTYVAGEETAAIDSIEGGPGKPRDKPPYPGEAGLFGKPTTVNNVETLAHVPSIIRRGASWYGGIGTAGSTGTMLFTLGDEVEKPGVYELPFGACYRDLIYGRGGGPKGGAAIRAIQPAMSCAFLGVEYLDVPIAYETLAELGTSPGCGGVRLILEGQDLVRRIAEIAQFFMDEQCGQCPPCRMETNQFVHVLKGVLSGKKGDFAGHLNKIASFTRGKGKCSLIEMAASPVLSAVKTFHADFVAKAGDASGEENSSSDGS